MIGGTRRLAHRGLHATFNLTRRLRRRAVASTPGRGQLQARGAPINSLSVRRRGERTSGGSKTLRTKAVSVSAGGKIDLYNHKLVVDYSGASPLGSWDGAAYTGIEGLIASGRNGGTWNGSGIVTSAPTALGPSQRTTLGVADASDVLSTAARRRPTGAERCRRHQRLVIYTYAGDANLDTKIDPTITR